MFDKRTQNSPKTKLNLVVQNVSKNKCREKTIQKKTDDLGKINI